MKTIFTLNVAPSFANGGVQPNREAAGSTLTPGLQPHYLSLKNFVSKKLSYCVLAIFIVCLNINSVSAQDKWNFLIEPYLMIPNMNGEVAVRQLPSAKVDADAGDIFGNLRMAAMLYFEANTDKWAFSSDIVFMDLKQEVTPGTVVTGGDAFAKQLAAEFAAMKRITPWFDVGAALRITDIKADLELQTVAGPSNASNRETWVDPVIILRAQTPLDQKFILQFRGDFGGFGVGSDFTWQVQANAGYRFSKLLSTTVGYRLLDMDYEKGDGSDRFLYDMAISGIVLRIGFNF